MNIRDMMYYILIAILLLCGYIYLLQAAVKRTQNSAAVPLISVLLLVIYLMIGIPVIVIISRLGSMETILLSLLLLASCVFLVLAVSGLIRNFRSVRKGMMGLFLVYLLAVAYITVFSRDGTNDATISMIRFDSIEEAIRTRSLEPMNHIFLNIAMLVPLGFLFPMICPEKLGKWSYALVLGMMLTTAIEMTQMLLVLGQADLTDIITNTLGTLIGYWIFAAVRRFHLLQQ